MIAEDLLIVSALLFAVVSSIVFLCLSITYK